jgi:outer membrane protein assembly factor BamA
MNPRNSSWLWVLVLAMGTLLASSAISSEPPPAQALSEEDNAVVARFTQACADMGYLAAIVNVTQGDAGKTVDVQLGPQYRLGTITITGNRRFKTDQLLVGVPASGDIYSVGRVKNWIDGILKRYSDAGATATVESTKLDFDDANQVASLTVNLKEAY